MSTESVPMTANTKTSIGIQNGSNAATSYVNNSNATTTTSSGDKANGESKTNYDNASMINGLKNNPIMTQSKIIASANEARLAFSQTTSKTPPTGSVWTSSTDGAKQISSFVSPSIWGKASNDTKDGLNTDRGSQLVYSAEEAISDMFNWC